MEPRTTNGTSHLQPWLSMFLQNKLQLDSQTKISCNETVCMDMCVCMLFLYDWACLLIWVTQLICPLTPAWLISSIAPLCELLLHDLQPFVLVRVVECRRLWTHLEFSCYGECGRKLPFCHFVSFHRHGLYWLFNWASVTFFTFCHLLRNCGHNLEDNECSALLFYVYILWIWLSISVVCYLYSHCMTLLVDQLHYNNYLWCSESQLFSSSLPPNFVLVHIDPH